MSTPMLPSIPEVRKFRAALESEKGAFGPFMISTDPALVEAAGYAGYDFVLLDMEHGPGTFHTLQNLIRAANVAKVCPIVRVPRGTDIYIDRALDVGAGGVMVPQIDTAEQAAAAVHAAKYGPIGGRGICRFVRSAGYGAIPGPEYFPLAQETCVLIQVEGKKALENIDEILDVPGIDVIFIGPYDISGSLGIPGQVDHPDVIACAQQIIDKAAAKGVKVGCFSDSAAVSKKWRSMGVKFLGYASEVSVFLRGAMEDVADFAQL